MRYVGEPVAVVIADNAGVAEDALGQIGLDIEHLAAVTSREAAASDKVLLFDGTTTNRPITLTAVRGNADAAFRAADYVRRERFIVQRHSAIPMEPRGLMAEWDAGRGQLTVWGARRCRLRSAAYWRSTWGYPLTLSGWSRTIPAAASVFVANIIRRIA